MPKRGPGVMIIQITWCRLILWLFLDLTVRSISEPGLALYLSRKRSERYMEICREVDTSTTKKSCRITFTCIVMGNRPVSPDRSEHQEIWETVMRSSSEKNHVRFHHLRDISNTSRLNSILRGHINIFYQGDSRPEKQLSVLMLIPPGWFPGSRCRSLG